jgi:hypothetical protein
MSDEHDTNAVQSEAVEQARRSPEEEAFLKALHQRKQITESLKSGTLPCLPGKDGYADTEPAVNAVNRNPYHGDTLLYLKACQKRDGFPTAEYVTEKDVKTHGFPLREDAKSVTLQGKSLFNIAQTTCTAGYLKEFRRTMDGYPPTPDKLGYYMNDYTPKEREAGYAKYEPQKPGPKIVCASTDPEKYLGQYLAAVSMGGRFKVNPEQAAEFSKKMEGSLFERMENGYTDPFKLQKICRDASQNCKEVMKELSREPPKLEQVQKLEHKKTHSRTM